MRNDFESNYLMHYQRPGAHWGIMNGPPYPLGSEQLSAEQKRKAKGKFSISKMMKDHKRKKQRKAALKKAQAVRKAKSEEKKKEEEFAKKKQEILRSGDPKEILKYRKQLTDVEIQSAKNRIANENELKKMVKASEKTGMDKIDKMMKTVGQVTDWAETGMKAYDKTAEIYNMWFAQNESEKWPRRGK